MNKNKKVLTLTMVVILFVAIIFGFYQFFMTKNDKQIVNTNFSEKSNKCPSSAYSIVLAPTPDPYSNEIKVDRKMKQLSDDSLKKLNCVVKNNNGVIPTNDLEELKPLEFLDLRELIYQETIISDFSFLSKLTNLIDLRLSTQTDISDLSPISGLKNLVNLDVDMNNVSDLSSLKNLNNLETLFICDNPNISDLSPLENLPNLKKLYLNGETKKAAGISSLRNKQGLTIIDCGQ